MTHKYSKLFFIGFIAAAAVVAFAIFFKPDGVNEQASTSANRSVAALPGYCMAIRGNGELQPAHWGAMARTVEQLGIPAAMAGGSSATITMMVMEAIAAHPMIAKQNVDVQKQRASLLWKSLYGFFGELKQTKEWKHLTDLYGQYAAAKKEDKLSELRSQISAKQFAAALLTLKQAIALGAVDIKSARPLLQALASNDQNRSQFYLQQMNETAAVFGKFNAESDDNLFFRMGIVSFEKAAESVGKIASFYSARAETPKNMKTWNDFFDACALNSEGMSWPEIVKMNPVCQTILHTLFMQTKSSQGHFENIQVGSVIPAFPITAVLVDSAADDFREARKQYHEQLDPHFGRKFQIRNPENVRIGYWGDPQRLESMKNRLATADEKSRRFLALGGAAWKQVLSLSPAEPGLSPLKEFKTANGEEYISAGGWPDLQPVLALKAAGCENVVFLTRQGGESIFGQGVAKRLLNLDRDWKFFRSNDKSVQQLNDSGDPNDMTSLWSNLYNLANPQSSASQSLSQANAILCTNWNAYDVKKEFSELIENSYRSSYWINPNLKSSFVTKLSPVLSEKKPGCMAQ